MRPHFEYGHEFHQFYFLYYPSIHSTVVHFSVNIFSDYIEDNAIQVRSEERRVR